MKPRLTPNTRPLKRLGALESPKNSALYTRWSSTGTSKERLDTKGKAYLTLDETFRGLPSLRKTILSNQFSQLVLIVCLYLRKHCSTTQTIACTRANRIYSTCSHSTTDHSSTSNRMVSFFYLVTIFQTTIPSRMWSRTLCAIHSQDLKTEGNY